MIERTGGQFDEKHDQLAHEHTMRSADGLSGEIQEAETVQNTDEDEDEE